MERARNSCESAPKAGTDETSGSGQQEAGSLHSFIVPDSSSGERLDRFLCAAVEAGVCSRERVKRAVKEGDVLLDGNACVQPSRRLFAGQHVDLRLEAPVSGPKAEEGSLRILYRDASVLVLDKPAGLTVHPAPSCPEGTLVNRLLRHVPELAAFSGMRPGIVHRIDKDTSGLLVVALTEPARLGLAEAFAGRAVRKEYLALVHGVPQAGPGAVTDADGYTLIDAPIGRHPTAKTRMAVVTGGRPARSGWRVLHAAADNTFSLLAVRIHTGRTHQIRVHMAHVGHPLLGDATYGGKVCAALAPRQMLHAWKLAFTHPESGEPLAFTCPVPEDFSCTLFNLSRRPHRVILTGLPGCGKSLALEYLAGEGLPVASADALVRGLYEPGMAGWQALRIQYGKRFIKGAKAPVDKAALTAALAEEPGLRRELEQLIHPLVAGELERFFAEAGRAGEGLACAEIPLFLEAGWNGSRPPEGLTLTGVHCPLEIRRERLHQRGWDDALIDMMESWQWPEQKKMAACDVVLDNTGSPEQLKAQITALVARLRERRQQDEAALQERFAALWA